MNKTWLVRLANDIEERFGKEKRNQIFGDISAIKIEQEFLAGWFEKFTSGMDELDDKEFLRQMMVKRCPCGGGDAQNGQKMKEFYDNSETLVEFVDQFREWLHKKYRGDIDKMELRGNILYMIKHPVKSKKAGSCGKGCHCSLAKYTEKVVSDIFCHCCTIGHTGGMFKAAFGADIKMEFIESIICGGNECTMAIHLPIKH